jgi:hypothetical protein
MKYCHIFEIDEATLTQDELADVCRFKPEARTLKGFQFEVISEDPYGGEFLRTFVESLRRRGVKRQMHSKPGSYGYYVMRYPEKADIISSELLLLGYQKKLKRIGGLERDEQERLVVLAADCKPVLRFGSTYPNNFIIVSDSVRQMLEKSELVGFQFMAISLKGKSSLMPPAPPWELGSSVTLPKLANTHRLVHPGMTGTEPFQGDYSRLVLINDEPFFGAELHYRRSDLAALGQFDVANTLEKFRTPHPLVISQRFYQHCLQNKISLEVEPVRIDPD